MPLNFSTRGYPVATLTTDAGRLRPLTDVLLRKRLNRTSGRLIARRPIGWREHWPRSALNGIYRNGHQARRHAAFFEERLRRSQLARLTNQG